MAPGNARKVSGECEKSEGVGKLTKKNKKPKHLGLGENKSEKKRIFCT